MSTFENLGVKLKVERGNRVFPESDKAKDIVDAMRTYCNGARVIHEQLEISGLKIANVTATGGIAKIDINKRRGLRKILDTLHIHKNDDNTK